MGNQFSRIIEKFQENWLLNQCWHSFEKYVKSGVFFSFTQFMYIDFEI